jgi:hypothetical protein
MLVGKLLDITKDLVWGQVCQGVLDPSRVSGGVRKGPDCSQKTYLADRFLFRLICSAWAFSADSPSLALERVNECVSSTQRLGYKLLHDFHISFLHLGNRRVI